MLQITARPGPVHTIPLFRLFPGRPSRIFSSLTAFLGGIFLLAYDRRWEEVGEYIGWRFGVCTKQTANAGPAAGSENNREGELKRRLNRRDRVLAVVRGCSLAVVNHDKCDVDRVGQEEKQELLCLSLMLNMFQLSSSLNKNVGDAAKVWKIRGKLNLLRS